jgi:hypothetical protein
MLFAILSMLTSFAIAHTTFLRDAGLNSSFCTMIRGNSKATNLLSFNRVSFFLLFDSLATIHNRVAFPCGVAYHVSNILYFIVRMLEYRLLISESLNDLVATLLPIAVEHRNSFSTPRYSTGSTTTANVHVGYVFRRETS